MEAKEKAKELVEKYKKYVNGYIGSSMLTNTEYPETILNNAIQCALISVNEILNIYKQYPIDDIYYYYLEVKKEIERL
jgi:hypothetical protein